MSEKPEAWTAADSIIWPHLAAKLVREQHAEIERLKAENEALRRDAERYRWLRDNAAGFSGRTLDAVTDAALRREALR